MRNSAPATYLLKNCSSVRTSMYFRPQSLVSDFQCRSQKLMLRDGLTLPASNGVLYFLPMFVRALEKFVNVVDAKMKDIGAQKLIMPSLTDGNLFKKSGRWMTMGDELFTLRDRHDHDMCLAPTHEEAVTNLVAHVPGISHKDLPLMLYQITTKFRDERRPKFGALRAREFIMKDLYTFDKDLVSAQLTYNRVSKAYSEILHSLGVKFVKVHGSTGAMGGSHSDEYHLLSDIGEDKLFLCKSCDYGVNADFETPDSCPLCKASLDQHQGIEVGHAFLLGTTYSETFKAELVKEDSSREAFQMGCFGLGMTRTIAAVVEVMARDDYMRWPLSIAPFLVGIITPKKGSKEVAATSFVPHLERTLFQLPSLHGNILLDDYNSMTIGRRVNGLSSLGIPYIIVVGKKVLEERPQFEVIDVYKEKTDFITLMELVDFFREKLCPDLNFI